MKWHIIAMLASVAISLTGLGLIVNQTDPYDTQSAVRLLFFASFFVALWGSVSLVSIWFRYKFGKQKVSEQIIHFSYLLGFFFSMIVFGIIAMNIWI